MKNSLIKYFNSIREHNNKMLSLNTLSEEDKANILAVVGEIESLVDTLEAMPEEDTTAISELKEAVTALQEKVSAINEKINQEKNIEPTMTENNYLSTNQAVADFCSSIRNSKNAAEFHSNWNQYLSTNGVTTTGEGFLPEVVKGKIQDIWDRNADWLRDLNHIGAKRYTIRKNDSAQGLETSRAKGFKKGDTKTSQSLTFSSKLVTTQFIYKLQAISLEDVWNDDGSLIDYIVRELVDQILFEEKRAILVGDGRTAGSTGKIDKIEAIAKSTADAYTNVASVTEDGFLIDDFRSLTDSLHNPNSLDVFVFMSKADLRTLSRVQSSSTSTPIYLPVEQVAEQIGASRIITTDLLGATYKGIAMIPSQYVLIGENVLNPTLYTWHDGYKNEDVFRYECPIGGAIEGLKSTAVLLA